MLHYHKILYELFTTSYHVRESFMKIKSLVTLYLWAYMYFYPSFPYFLTNLGGLCTDNPIVILLSNYAFHENQCKLNMTHPKLQGRSLKNDLRINECS